MNKIYLILIVASIFLAFSVEGRISRIIDDFTDTPYNARYVPSQAEVYDNTPPYDWFSPYNADVGLVPFTNFKNAANVIGGQRDIVIGHVSSMQTAASISCSVNRANGNVPANFQLSLPTNFVGGIYLQWDGIDNATPAQGALLNKGIGSDNGLGSNADGTVDFTFGGAARGILISVQTDLPILYELKAVNLADDTSNQGAGNNLDLTVQRNEITGFTRFYFTYSDLEWSKTPIQFDWTKVAGFQLKVFTEEGAPTAQSLDSRIFLIQIGAFEVGGTVYADCLCDNLDLTPLSGIQVDIYTLPSFIVTQTQTTDAQGKYYFSSMFTSSGGFIDAATTYRICLRDINLTRCPNSAPRTVNGCYDFTTADPFQDQFIYDFTISRSTTFNVPTNRSLECGAETLPPTTGNAQLTECNGTVTTIQTWTDTLQRSSCAVTISRRWASARGDVGTQTIVVTDTQPPRFVNNPTSTSVECGDSNAVSLSNWVNTLHAGATGNDDCSNVTIVSNWNNIPLTTCGSVTVGFTVRDNCGLTSPTISATYTVTDTTAPTMVTPASPLAVECNFKVTASNPNTQIANWINNHGGARASDTCTTVSSQLTWTDNFSDTVITSINACSFSESVTFIVYDTCGRTASTTASVSVRDTVGPTITRQAQPGSAQCALDGSNNVAFQSWRNSHGTATATDDCVANDSSLTWSDNYTGGTVGGTCSGAVSVIFTVYDGCGVTSSTTNSFTITDSTPPTLTTAASNANPQCNGAGNTADWAAFLSSHGGAVATDNCGAVTWSNNAPASPPAPCTTGVSVTFTATQSCDPFLTVRTTAVYSVTDSAAPIFTTNPSNGASECSAEAPAAFQAWLANNAGAVISDACSNEGIRITNNFQGTTLANGCNSVATVTFVGRDGCSNANTGLVATYTISDSLAPTITTQPTPSVVDCNVATNQQSFVTWRNNHAGAVASDCLAVTWTSNDTSPIGSGCNAQRVVQFTASDPCNHSVNVVSTFSVSDNTPPTINRNATSATYECNGNGNISDINNFLNTNAGATATDNCGEVTWTNDFTALSDNCTRSALVTFTASDPCQLQSRTTATITVRDTGAPIISPRASDTIVDCSTTSNSGQYTAFVQNRGGARATDLCQSAASLIWTNNATLAPSGCNSAVVTFTVTDACSQSASTTARFTIVDATGPTFTRNPSSVSYECNGSGNTADYQSWVSNYGGATASDDCTSILTWSHNAPTTGPVGCGTVTVLFTVADQCQNSASATATFTIIDSTAPVFATPAQNVTVECDQRSNNGNLQTWLLAHGNSVVTDTCYSTNSLIFRNDFISLSSSDRCTQYVDVVFTAIDGCAQFSQSVATYTVIDSTSPVLTRPAENRFYECNDITNVDDINNWILVNGAANAIDTCTEIEWTNDFDLVYPIECQGPKTVTFTASDICGHSISTSAQVEIDDTLIPIFLNFPRDVIITCADPTDPSWTREPDVFDSYCDNELTATYSDVVFQEPADRLCPGDYIITRTWFLADDCGNMINKDQIITVTLPDGPCTFTPCPDCGDINLCCESSLERVPCTPVACNPVGCNAVDCTVVPCLPKVCGSAHVPIYDDDDGPIFTSPLPVQQTVTCEPIYVYVFDDDEGNAVPVESAARSSSNAIVASFTLLLSIFFLMI